jgi:DNA-binding XRE family transcriptional regulator
MVDGSAERPNAYQPKPAPRRGGIGSRIVVANEQRGGSDAGSERGSKQREKVPSQRARKSDWIDIHIGVRLRQRRILLGITQEALAQRIGISFQQMQKYEIGENRISAARLFRLSQLLDVPVTWFFGGMKPEDTGS